MLELLNVNFRFYCRSSRPDKQGLHPIILRVIYRRDRRDLSTGLGCAYEDWDSDLGKLRSTKKHNQTINRNLDLIRSKAMDTFEQFRFRVGDFTIDELADAIKGKEDKPELLIGYLEGEKASIKKRVGVDISQATYDKYRRSATHVQNFLLTEFKVKNYALNRINGQFLEKYFQHLRGTRGIQHNTAVKYLTFFKTVLMPALRNGAVPHDPFKDVKFRIKPVNKGFLTQEEVNQICEASLSVNLSRIRDIFLLSCYTGLAYADVKQLKKHHIISDGEGSYHIRKPRQKTGQESIIPLLPAAIRILQKYSPTNDFRDFIWRVSSNQKTNQRLKEIAIIAGIDKQLHMHLARHTFATTVTLSNGVPIETVSNMLGHASLKQTQHYAKILGMKVKADIVDSDHVDPGFWDVDPPAEQAIRVRA